MLPTREDLDSTLSSSEPPVVPLLEKEGETPILSRSPSFSKHPLSCPPTSAHFLSIDVSNAVAECFGMQRLFFFDFCKVNWTGISFF